MTAVEWLEAEYEKLLNWHIPMELLEQAKKMEKEQIIEARKDGSDAVFTKNEDSNEQYYNETYKLE